MRLSFVFVSVAVISVCDAASVSVQTTSGLLQGSETNGLLTFKGVRFGQAPTGSLRWEPPVPFSSTAPQNATSMGPACVQQFPFVVAAIDETLFNTPPPPESEDCLFLNVWAPASATHPLPVLIWIYGGDLAFGTASTFYYDGASLASNQNIIVVSFNYRTNVFGFPESPELPLAGNNLGFLDQELAFQWVQQNIVHFGGDPRQVTIMGQSSGGFSVAAAYVRHVPSTVPFRAAVMLSGAVESTSPTPSFSAFNAMASSVGCGQAPGAARLACLRNVSASTIRNYTNGPSSGAWSVVVDNATMFADPLQRIRDVKTSRAPFIIGNTQDDGTIFAFALNVTDLAPSLASFFGTFITADQVRALYPSGLSDNAVFAEAVKDFQFLCPAELWGAAAVGAGITNVYRYAYGPVFADYQSYPNAGAAHASEIPQIFGTFNATTATSSEVTLSHTMQTVFANFIKNPEASPAPNWPRFVPGNTTTLAKLAYAGNVALGNVVQTAGSNSLDAPCDALWNQFLDFRV
ncbi:Alpha/Beta hydrolase protein [Mycena polygramma]|nr:Alpha/Beta hydrolase protein [Mycena polygramma]